VTVAEALADTSEMHIRRFGDNEPFLSNPVLPVPSSAAQSKKRGVIWPGRSGVRLIHTTGETDDEIVSLDVTAAVAPSMRCREMRRGSAA